MTIQEAHNQVLLRINKDQTGYATHEEIDRAMDFAQMVRFNQLVGSPATYQPGRYVGTPGYGVTQKIHDDLLPFKVVLGYNNQDYTTLNSRGTGPKGVMVLPSNYLHTVALYRATDPDWQTVTTLTLVGGVQSFNTTLQEGRAYRLTVKRSNGAAYDANISIAYGATVLAAYGILDSNIIIFTPTAPNLALNVNSELVAVVPGDPSGSILVEVQSEEEDWEPVEFLSEDQWADRVSSKLITPSNTDPICKMFRNGGTVNSIVIGSTTATIQVFPRQGYNLEFVYLKRPAAPVFAYTVNEAREVTYNAGASTQLEWKDQALNVIIELTINILAQNLQDQALEQHSEIKNQQPR